MKCIYKDCKTRPNFNFEGELKGLYCKDHALDNMIDIKNKKCIYPLCKTRPNFNFEGELKKLYCKDHALDNMIDIKSKKCIYPLCKTQPSFNLEGELKALYCKTHALDNMIDIKNKKCIYPLCKTIPSFNFEGKLNALYCKDHSLDNMIDIKHKRCKNNWCYNYYNKKFEGYCMYCFINMFPEKTISRNYKTKEYCIVEYIKNKYSNYDWIFDKKIQNGCSKRRPDILLDLGYQIIIIEIDENQHIKYDCSCENKRIMELSQDLEHRPIIFIRFNPDKYEVNGKNKKSCWSITKNGICIINPAKKEEWLERLETLSLHVNYWLVPENKTDKTIETIELFYDN